MLLPIGKSVNATVSYKDAAGNLARVDGVPTWSVDRPYVLTVEPAADGLSAKITPAGSVGSAQIAVVADADLGSGVRELVVLGTVEVVAGEAVVGTIEFGEPS